VSTCVIFNPVARGNKARNFKHWLDGIATECTLMPTACAGDARRLAKVAVEENFELIIAAGGDGTVNEVLNGIADAPGGFEQARLGVLPLGTVNVFTRELKFPAKLADVWAMLQQGREKWIDVPVVEFGANGKTERRYFAQLAGAGLDARAIELVSWKQKKQVGPLAYVIAGLKALRERKPRIKVTAAGRELPGELILIGNGRLYGGSFAVFPAADLTDGILDVCCIPSANFGAVLKYIPPILFRGLLPESAAPRLRAKKFRLTCETQAGFELDGEWIGHLPATFSISGKKIRVIVP
jgi:diacylglycerol kinase (ATP)